MKSLLNSVFTTYSFLLLMVCSCSAFAQTTSGEQEAAFYSDFYVMQIKPLQFEIKYNYPVTDRVQVRIFDKTGNMLFGEKVLVYKKYHRLFDFSVFNDGNYVIQLTDGDREYKKRINIETVTTRTATPQGNQGIIVSGL